MHIHYCSKSLGFSGLGVQVLISHFGGGGGGRRYSTLGARGGRKGGGMCMFQWAFQPIIVNTDPIIPKKDFVHKNRKGARGEKGVRGKGKNRGKGGRKGGRSKKRGELFINKSFHKSNLSTGRCFFWGGACCCKPETKFSSPTHPYLPTLKTKEVASMPRNLTPTPTFN